MLAVVRTMAVISQTLQRFSHVRLLSPAPRCFEHEADPNIIKPQFVKLGPSLHPALWDPEPAMYCPFSPPPPQSSSVYILCPPE